mgnify:CR=1 FL=1
MATKTTGSKAASSASKVLSSESTGAASKTSAGSALTQKATPKEQTSAGAATAASQVLRDGVPTVSYTHLTLPTNREV